MDFKRIQIKKAIAKSLELRNLNTTIPSFYSSDFKYYTDEDDNLYMSYKSMGFNTEDGGFDFTTYLCVGVDGVFDKCKINKEDLQEVVLKNGNIIKKK